MWEGGIKNDHKNSDVFYGRPQGNRLEDLSLPTLICPPSCDCATAACVRVCSQAMGLEWTRNSLLWNRYKSRIWKSWEECSHRLEERDASWACEWARVSFSPMSPKLVWTLSTYSRKLEYHNGIIIFWNQLKNSRLSHLSKPKFHVFSLQSAVSFSNCKQKQTKQLKHFLKSQVW